MSAPREPSHVLNATEALPPAEDFAARKTEALGWLADWCRDSWTNFNDHDPGVILLDELIYAANDAAYRASHDVTEILRRAAYPVPAEENALYAPEAILPMAPLTSADYLRFLYDQVPGLVFAAVEPLMPPNGRWRVRFALSPQASTAETAAARTRIENLLSKHRPLGERFDEVLAEEYVHVELHIRVRLAAGADPAIVAANLHAAASQALLPGPRFQPPERTSPDVTLTGPLLARGWLDDRELPQRCTGAEAHERVARALLGVRFVREILQLEFSNQFTLDAFAQEQRLFALARDVHLDFPVGSGDRTTEREMHVLFAAMPDKSPVDSPEARRAAVLIASGGEKPRSFPVIPTAPGSAPASAEPERTLETLGAYSSIQESLPGCFGLQLDSSEPGVEHAAAWQLKGYLLPFEQMFANFFAQLDATASYFSHRPQTHTAFTAPLRSVPNVFPLLANALETEVQAASDAGGGLERDGPYATALRAIAESAEVHRLRRGRVLDHLLARFNESFPSSDPTTFETIANREALLEAYPSLGWRRALGAADTPPDDGARPRSGLEEKIQLLLRRDTQDAPGPDAGGESDTPNRPTDFYHVYEALRFYASSATEVAADTLELPISSFAPVLYHVFVNWTFVPLTSGFRSYVEERVLENAPAHLLHRFIWLETQPAMTSATAEFQALDRAWAAEGCPAVRFVTAKTRTGRLRVVNTPAARLLAWLQRTAAGIDA